MKKTMYKLSAFLMALAISGSLLAQVPQKFNYQGIARDAKGNPLSGKTLSLKLSVLPTSDANAAEYEEVQTVTTNQFGLYTLQIGNGQSLTGDMKSVKWETGNKYIRVAIDPQGGTNYADAGTTQLLSVPYAIYADKAGTAKNSGDRTGAVNSNAAHVAGDVNYVTKFTALNVIGKSQIFDNGSNVGIGTGTPNATSTLHLRRTTDGNHLYMENPTAGSFGAFRMINDNPANFATFTKYGSTYPGGYTGIAALYPFANMLGYGNNGPFLNAGTGNIGFAITKGGTNRLKIHIDAATEKVGIGGNSVPAAQVHFNNTDAGNTGDTLKITNGTTGHTINDGLDIRVTGNNARITNRENAFLIMGTNNTDRLAINAAGNVGIGTVTPTTTLDVNGQIRMQGGAPGAGKLMVSDATGIGSWSTAAAAGLVSGSGTVNSVPKFSPDGNTLSNSLLTDSAGLFYNTPYDANYFLKFRSPNPFALNNWMQFAGNNNGGTFMFVEDSSYGLKGLVLNRIGSNFGDSMAIVHYNPFTNNLTMGSNFGSHLNLNVGTGDLGLGTNSPTNKFHNTGTLRSDGQMHTNMSSLANTWYQAAFYNPNAGVGSAISLFTSDAGNSPFDGGQLSLSEGVNPDVQLANRENGGIRFYTNGYGEKMVIAADGKVGIGTANPVTGTLVVNNSSSNRVLDVVGTGSATVGQTVNISRDSVPASNNDMLQISVPTGSPDDFQFIECDRGGTNSFVVDGNGAVTFANALQPAGNPGSNGQVMVSSGAGAAPTWAGPKTLPGSIAQIGMVHPNTTAPTATSSFLSASRVQVNITSTTQVVQITGTVTLGSTAAGGADGLDIFPAYNTTNVATPVSTIGLGTWGLRTVQNTRNTYTVTGIVTGLAPGTYYFGVGGRCNTIPGNWNNNEFGYVSVTVINQ